MGWQTTLDFDPEAGDARWTPQGEDHSFYIGELTVSHRRHLFSWMMRRADRIQAAYSREYERLYFRFSHMTDGWDDDPDWVFESEDDLRRQEPVRWLIRTNFMRALAALLIADGAAVDVALWEKCAEVGRPLSAQMEALIRALYERPARPERHLRSVAS